MLWLPHETVTTTEAFVAECIAAAERGARLPYVLSEHGKCEPIGMLEARPVAHKVDFGYVLSPEYWRRGFMPEAIAGLAGIALALPEVFRVVRSRARLHADHARRQRRYSCIELAARHLRLLQPGRSGFIHAVQREEVLGEIDPNVENGHDFPFRVS